LIALTPPIVFIAFSVFLTYPGYSIHKYLASLIGVNELNSDIVVIKSDKKDQGAREKIKSC
jgi:hypothetical protein